MLLPGYGRQFRFFMSGIIAYSVSQLPESLIAKEKSAES